MLHLAKDLNDGSSFVYGSESDETDQLVFEISSDKDIAVRISGIFSFDRVKPLMIVPKQFTLANWGFVINTLNSSYERIVEFDFLYDHTRFFGLLDGPLNRIG